MCETVRDILNKQDYWQHCIKIDNALNEVLDPNRALWEMVQNARDLSKQQCKIKITLSNEKLIFAHNGECFNFESLTSLIKQVSTCDKRTSQDEYAGRFGTGFLETHSFNRVFTINGSYQTLKGQYISLDDFEINRDYSDINTLFSQMQSEIKKAEQFENNEVEYVARKEYTEFSFGLSGTAKNQAIKAFNKFSEMVPYVMVFNSRISEITLIDKIEGRDIVFERGETKNEIDGLLSTKIISNGSGQLYYYLQLLDGDSKIIMPFYSTSQGMNIELLPKLFCYFPLLGTENFGLQFIFNSSKFEPKEKRNGILLPDCNNEKTRKLASTNMDLIEKLSDVALDYLSKHIENINNVVEFANIDFSSNVGDELSNEAKVFFEELKNKWVDRFKKFKIVETDKERCSVSDYTNVKFFDEKLVKFLSNKDNSEFLNIVYHFASKVCNLPREDEILKWSEIVQHWGCSTEHFISLDKICSQIKEKDEYLHQFLKVIELMNETDLYDKHKIIPNREGSLYELTKLVNADTITDELYNSVKQISNAITDKFVAVDFRDIKGFNGRLYDRIRLRDDVNGIVSTIKINGYGYAFNERVERALYNYCSIFYVSNSGSNRRNLMPIMGEILGYSFEEVVVKRVNSDEPDLFETPFNNLFEHLCKKIGANKCDLNLLLLLLQEACKSETLKKIINEHNLFPNQNGDLCKCDTLFKQASVIDNELKNIYKKAVGLDLRDKLVNTEFEQLLKFKEYDVKQLGDKIEECLDVRNEEKTVNPITLDIIRFIEEKQWKGIFKYIEDHMQVLVYRSIDNDSKNSIYQLMKVKDADTLKTLAEFSDLHNIKDILRRAEDFILEEQNMESDFKFKHEIGTRIEGLIKGQLEKEMSQYLEIKPSIQNIQDGQDIIISYKGSDLFYIEIKSKWNFDNSAYMSKNQIKRAVGNQNSYALCCVDLTDKSIPNRHYPSFDEIKNNIHVLSDIGYKLDEVMSSVYKAEKDDSDTQIKIDGDYKCTIPKRLFVSGQPFDSLVSVIVDKIRKEESR